MIQTILIKISATTPKPRMIPNDTERQRALEGLPDYKLEPVCPWLPGEHTHLAGDQNL